MYDGFVEQIFKDLFKACLVVAVVSVLFGAGMGWLVAHFLF